MADRLNDLDNTAWLRFLKSWEIVNPAPRSKQKYGHPAPFPEELAASYIEFFTQEGQSVLDPFAGTGTTLVAAMRLNREAVGIELSREFAGMANDRLRYAWKALTMDEQIRIRTSEIKTSQMVVCGDARDVVKLADTGPYDYCLTSPPYWDMLHQEGAENQKKRRDAGVHITYSDAPDDLGNIHDYQEFLGALVSIFTDVASVLRPGAYMTVVLQNIRKGSAVHPLAWEFAIELARTGAVDLSNEKLWLQDNKSLFPFAVGTSSFVTNQHHHYCLNFRRPV